ATIRRITSGCAATWRPMMQKVALMWYSASRSSTCMEYASGPSSKVSATPSVPVVVREPAGPIPPEGEACGLSGSSERDGPGDGALALAGPVDGECDGEGTEPAWAGLDSAGAACQVSVPVPAFAA